MGVSAQLVETHATPRSVHAVTWSPDGERLVAGGGCFFGRGFVMCVERGAASLWMDASRDRKSMMSSVCISGLVFDASGLHLASSVWAMRHQYAEPQLQRIEGNSLVPVALDPESPERLRQMKDAYVRGTATGVILAGRWMIVRRNSRFHEFTLWATRLPDGVLGGSGGHLTSSRLAHVGKTVITAVPPSPVRRRGTIQMDYGTFDDVSLPDEDRVGDGGGVLVSSVEAEGVARLTSRKNPHALSAAEARRRWSQLPNRPDDNSEQVVLGVREPPRGNVTAGCIDASGTRLTTCGSDGSIATWGITRMDDGTVDFTAPVKRAGHVWPIAAVCHLDDGDLVATGDRGGTIRVWEGARLVVEWTVDRGSIRALAAHPRRRRLAVGFKSLPGGHAEGGIAVFDY
jgi:hypothetical protein